MSGKGSKRRPQQASDAEVQASWDRIFSGGAEETRKNTATWVAENEPDMTAEKVEEYLGRMKVHFSSKTDQWATPQDFFDKLNLEFQFELDVCADSQNKKCDRFFTENDDGLSKDWSGQVCWMNPPYGKHIKLWMKKAYESSKFGSTVVCLVPARTDTAWWHDYAAKGEVRFVRGRLKFGGSKNCAPFPSAVVVFRPTPPTPHAAPCTPGTGQP